MTSTRRRTGLVALAAAITIIAGLTACEPVPTAPGTSRVVLFGDSVPNWLIRDGSSRGIDTTKYTLVNATTAACEPALPAHVARSRNGDLITGAGSCSSGWPSIYPPHLTIPVDTAIVMGAMHTMLDHKIDGVWTHPCRAAARNWYRDDLKKRLAYLKTKAEHVVLVLPAWPGPNSIWIMPSDYVKRADCVRQVMQDAADATGTVVLDYGTYLCPTSPTICKEYRTDDGVHVDAAKAPTVLKWLINAAQPAAGA